MVPRLTPIAAIVWLAFSPLVTSSDPIPIQATKPWTPPNDAVYVPYSGTVTAVDKVSITVRWPGEKPKRFPVSDALARGDIPREPRMISTRLQPYRVRETDMYRLTDVEVGDQVVIRYSHLGDIDTCDHIHIVKRPGGLVPPLPAGVESLARPKHALPGRGIFLSEIPYHEQMNAYWDLEDRGIPYPEKFGEYRRWPIAPQPREVAPKR